MITRSNHAHRAARPALLAAASLCALIAASPARAGCAPGNGGPRDYLCTGAMGATTFDQARTVALTGATASGGIAVAPVAGGNIGFTMDASSSVNGSRYEGETGVRLETTNGSIDTTTPSGSGINGAITAASGTALSARTTNGDINIKTGSGGVLTGGRYGAGLDAYTTGSGAINLDLGAKVSGYVGVRAVTTDGAINIKAGADIVGGYSGIIATATGQGAVNITTSGNVTGGYAGLDVSSGTGNISLNLGGDVTSSGFGVRAISDSGDVTINATGKVTSGTGIVAETGGVGAVTATTNGPVVAASGDGIDTKSADGWNTVNVGAGGVEAANNGVVATATGKGSVKVQVHGDVSGKAGFGVAAATNSGSIEIDLDSGKFISGAKAGVAVQTQTGDIRISNAGTIEATDTGVAVLIDANNGQATLNNAGTIKVDPGQIAIGVATGAALIKNTGVIDGAIVSTGVTTVDNQGTWNNAAGSYIQYLKNTGVISMGPDGGKVGALVVTGDASFGPGSYYNARITPTGNDVILVGGQATITGGVVKITAAQDGVYQRGSRYILMQALGGITGQFDGVISDASQYTGILSYDDKDVYLTVLLRDFRSFARTRNQWSVANAIYYASGQLFGGLGGQMLLALNQSSDTAVAASLTQLSGDGVVTGAANAALQTGHLFTSVLDDQQALWRDSQPRDQIVRRIEPFSYAPTRLEGKDWPVSRQNYAPAPVRRDDGLQRWRVWASGFGGVSSLHGDTATGSADQKLNSYGGALGVDYQMGSNMLFGVALGGSSSAFNAGNAQGSASGVHVGAYTGFRVQSFYGTASVAYSNFANKTTRTVAAIGGVAGEQEEGSFTSEEVRTRIEIGRRITSENFAVTPFTAIEIAHLHTQPFTERATAGVGLFALSFQGQGVASTPTFIGLKAEARLDMGGAILTPWISLAWRHEWSTSRSQTATLAALPGASFVIIGAKPARDAAQIKGGVNLAVTQQVAVFATFEGEFGSKNPVYAGKGGMKVAW